VVALGSCHPDDDFLYTSRSVLH